MTSHTHPQIVQAARRRRRALLVSPHFIVAILIAATAKAQVKDSFANTDWHAVESTLNPFGHAMRLTYQGPPPTANTAIDNGSPCNWASTGQSEQLATSAWTGTGIASSSGRIATKTRARALSLRIRAPISSRPDCGTRSR